MRQTFNKHDNVFQICDRDTREWKWVPLTEGVVYTVKQAAKIQDNLSAICAAAQLVRRDPTNIEYREFVLDEASSKVMHISKYSDGDFNVKLTSEIREKVCTCSVFVYLLICVCVCLCAFVCVCMCVFFLSVCV